MSNPLFENFRRVVEILDELDQLSIGNSIDLPKIAVIGSQSAGKSSLLENILGIEFLPRGEGCVTRTPVEIRMIYTRTASTPYAVFENETEKIHDFEQVSRKIVEATNKIAGGSKNIVEKPIIMKIFSDNCPNLTFIDLPGITRVPLKNQGQSEDIEKIVKSICKKYISNERVIILCVTPGNTDITTSDSLHLAREVDREGLRTFGVLTKIDIVDKGVDMKKVLTGEELPLKLGYHGIVNRSKQDMINKIKIKDALENEKMFFAGHPIYSSMDSSLFSTHNLISKLRSLYYDLLKKNVPEIAIEIQEQVKELQEKLKGYDKIPKPGPQAKLNFIWEETNNFSAEFKLIMSGSCEKGNTTESLKAIINSNFYKLYENINLSITEDYIMKAMNGYDGEPLKGFLNGELFKCLISVPWAQLKDPAFEALEKIHQGFSDYLEKLTNKYFSRFPALFTEITNILTHVLEKHYDKSRRIIETIIDCEIGYIFAKDSNYLAISDFPDSKKEELEDDGVVDKLKTFFKKESQQEKVLRKVLVPSLKKIIETYFKNIVRKLKDSIPRIIGFNYVSGVNNSMQMEISENLLKHHDLESLIQECDKEILERSELEKKLNVLKNAQKQLNKEFKIPFQRPKENKEPIFQKLYNKMFNNKENSSSPQKKDSKTLHRSSSFKRMPTVEEKTGSLKKEESKETTKGRPVNFGKEIEKEKPVEKNKKPNADTSLFGDFI